MLLIMLVSYTCVCPGDFISANNAAITRPPNYKIYIFFIITYVIYINGAKNHNV